MKKEVLFLFFILFISMLAFASAQAPPEPPEIIPGVTPENIQDVMPGSAEEGKDLAQDYLKKEWDKILRDQKIIGPIIRDYEKIDHIVDPIFKYTIGLEPSLSWLFALTFILWISFLIFLYRALEGGSSFSGTTSFIIALLIMIVFGGALKIIPKASLLIIELISKLNIWWVQLLVAIAVIVVLIIIDTFSKAFKDQIEEWKEKRAKEQEKEHREQLKTTATRSQESLGKFYKKVAGS